MSGLQKRVWVRSGVIEELDKRQVQLLELVLEKIRYYYRELHETRDCYRYPLSLSQLMKLTRRNSYAVMGAVRILANSKPECDSEPLVFYERGKSERNATHRPYRIFLRTR